MGVCVAAASVSCSNELVDDGLRPVGGNDSDGISFVVADNNTRGGSFGNRPGLSTRASVTTTDNMYKSAFAIYGDMSNLDSSNQIVIFNGTEVEDFDQDDKWTYSDVRYWFPDREFSFTAIHPAKVVGSNELPKIDYNDGSMSFDYTLPSDHQATDILVAGHRRKYTAGYSTDFVELNFGHIMTRINFVANIDKNSKIEIKSITIRNIASEASYSVKPAEIMPGASSTSDLAGSAWSTPTVPVMISKVAETNKIEMSVNNSTGIMSVSLFPEKDALILIPQDVSDNMIVEVTYSTGGTDIEKIEGNLSTVSSVKSWAAGKLYTYSFTIEDNNDYIVFSKPNVEDWKEASGASYIIMD